MRTCERLAREFGVSRSTILRDADFERGLELLRRVFGMEFAAALLTPRSRLNKSDVIVLRRVPPARLAQIGQGNLKELARQIKQVLAAPRRLREVQRAYLRLTAEDRDAFDVWLAELRLPQ